MSDGNRRQFVSLSKGRTPLGLPDDLPPGAHPMDWFLFALRDMLGPETAARFIGVSPHDGSAVSP